MAVVITADPDAAAEIAVGEARASHVDAPYPGVFTRWWCVAILTTLYSLSYMDRQIFALLVEPIRAAAGITDFEAGLLQGLAFSLFYATFGLLFGWATDRFHRRSIIFVGVVIWSVAATTCGAAHHFVHLALARFGVGAGEAALVPAANSILSDSFPRTRQATALSIFGIGPTTGSAMALLLGGLLISVLPVGGVNLPVIGLTEPWRIVFIATGLPGLLLAFLVWSFPEPARRQRLSAQAPGYKETLAFMVGRWRFYLGHFLGVGLLVAACNGFGAFMVAWLMRNHGLTISQAGVMLAFVVVIPGVIGVILTGALADWLMSRGVKDAHLRLLMASGVFQTTMILLAMAMPSLWWAAFFVGLFNLTAGFGGIGPAAIQLVTPNEFRGKVTALYGFFLMMIGFGLGPPLVGALTTYVYKEEHLVNWSIGTAFLILQPLGVLACWSALKAMRAAVTESDSWELEGGRSAENNTGSEAKDCQSDMAVSGA